MTDTDTVIDLFKRHYSQAGAARTTLVVAIIVAFVLILGGAYTAALGLSKEWWVAIAFAAFAVIHLPFKVQAVRSARALVDWEKRNPTAYREARRATCQVS